MSVRIIPVITNQEKTQCLKIREEVFVNEQNVPKSIEYDQYEANSDHLLILDGDLPIGTARVRYRASDKAKIERVAILKDFRGQGWGQKLMEYILSHLYKNNSIREIIISSQKYAIPFYEKLEFEVFGEEFIEADIPHNKMKKIITDSL